MVQDQNQDYFEFDLSDIAWDVLLGRMPPPSALVNHEMKNDFHKVHWDESTGEKRPWSKERSHEKIGPERLKAEDIIDAYNGLFKNGDDPEHAERVFRQAINDETIPEGPREAVEEYLEVHEGLEDYRDIITRDHNPGETVEYERLISPVKDKEYVLIDGKGLEELESGREIRAGESVFFLLNTVDKNFREYVLPETEDAEMRVEVYEEEGSLVLRVYDNGPGISHEEAERVFQPKEGDSTGLPVARYVLENYGGELEVYEPESGGLGLEARFDMVDF